jgi:hypothetical protein
MPPQSTYDAKGKPLLSWRVSLLPFLDEKALFDQFHHDEPWDSPHNLALLPRMPEVFGLKDQPTDPGMTYYQVFVAAPAYHGKYVPIFQAQPRYQITMGQISGQDGSSNTLLIVESGRAVPWTKPEDIEIDASIEEDHALLPLFGGLFPESPYFNAACADGSCHRLPRTAGNPASFKRWFRALVGVNDGEPVSVDQPE